MVIVHDSFTFLPIFILYMIHTSSIYPSFNRKITAFLVLRPKPEIEAVIIIISYMLKTFNRNSYEPCTSH